MINLITKMLENHLKGIQISNMYAEYLSLFPNDNFCKSVFGRK